MSRRQNGTKLSTQNARKHDAARPQLFDGVHTPTWMIWFPTSWVPYIQLARLSPPVPVLLIYFPHLFGLLHAAATQNLLFGETTRVAFLLLGGSFFFSNAIHIWNDLIDAPIDRQISRTCNRPIARGAISSRAAFLFTLSQAAGASCFLLLLPSNATLCAVPSIISNIYYPFAKRHTYFPQVVLGFCLQWAVVLGHCAITGGESWADPSVLCLFFGCMLWTVIYDTIYAFQDYVDDIKIGVKSTAIFFGEQGKLALWLISSCMAGSLIASGYFANMSIVYLVIAVGGSLWSLGHMVTNVDLKSPESCAWWFVYGFWGPAISICAGLLCEYYSKNIHSM